MAKRECRKCKEYIPYRYTDENGKCWNLQRRVFCVKCSPLGANNRRSDDPDIPPARAGRYENWNKDQKLLHQARIYKRKLQRKARLLEMHGNKCKVCGYNKCSRALTFHHLEPKKKKFGLSIVNMSKPWKEIVAEAKKCDLLCIRCHVELEDELASVNMTNYKQIIEQKVSQNYDPGEI